MAKKISDCEGAIVYFSTIGDKRKKGARQFRWAVHYKGESRWVNTREDLLKTLDMIGMVAIFGGDFKSWKMGDEGWRRNSPKDDPTKV